MGRVRKDLTAPTRKAAERQRKRDSGLKPLEVWAPPAAHPAIKAYALALQKPKEQ